MFIKTSDPNSIKPFLKKLYVPSKDSHKGQNGKILVIGGSSLFHAASIWAAEMASYIVDMVHYSSTKENGEIFLSLKKKFRNGMVIAQKDIESYVKEDDVVLVGPGMVRGKRTQNSELRIKNSSKLIQIKDEESYTFYLTKFLLTTFLEKKFVLDAGALQMMKTGWLKKRKMVPILTPHQQEFKTLFSIDISKFDIKEKSEVIEETARKNNCVILLKGVIDIVSDGNKTYCIEGGNAGLTKGGTGDVLAGLTAALYAKNEALLSCIIASYLLKRTGEKLFIPYGYWYNTNTVIQTIPKILYEVYRSV